VPKFLLEAAATGMPLIATDAPGCREIVKNNVNGFLVPQKDYESLAEKIRLLISDQTMCEKMGIESSKIVTQGFSEEKVVKETLSVYDDMLTR